MRTGNTKSCGCLKWELSKTRNLQHGMCRTSEYNIWASMKQRCLNPRNAAYEYYGGRGIKPCDEWLSFIPYFADTGSRPEGCSLNRIDNDGIYEPTNCSWADAKQQAHNRRPRRARKAKRRQFEPSPPPPLNDPPF